VTATTAPAAGDGPAARAWPRPAPALLALLPAWSALGLAVAIGRAPIA
jgi:hypothetical protein